MLITRIVRKPELLERYENLKALLSSVPMPEAEKTALLQTGCPERSGSLSQKVLLYASVAKHVERSYSPLSSTEKELVQNLVAGIAGAT